MKKRILTLLLLLGLVASAQAATYTIDVNGGGDFLTIQEGVDAASSGDSLLIEPGLYQGPGNRALYIENKVLTLIGSSGVPADVIIDGELASRILAIDDPAPAVTLEALTFKNGHANGPSGDRSGGAIASRTPSLTIRNCRFEGNRAMEDGGALRPYGGGAVSLEDCTFVNNTADDDGGAIGTFEVDIQIVGCLFDGNSCADNGAAIHLNSYSMTMSGSTIVNHELSALNIHNADLTLGTSILYNNGTGVTIDSGSTGGQSCNCFWDNDTDWNQAGGYDPCGDGDTICLDPMFVDPGAGDYTLQSLSPCLPANHPGGDVCGVIGAFTIPDPITIHVPGDYETIQAALDAANPGDTVELAAGIYTGDGNWDLVFPETSLTLTSAGETAIDCGGAHQGMLFDNLDAEIAVENITIRNGYATDGGGIEIHDTDVAFQGVVVENCEAEALGGGFLVYHASPVFEDCTVQGNTAAEGGGGMFVKYIDSQPVITDCRILDNTTIDGLGGGLCFGERAKAVPLEFTVIARNHAGLGGGGISLGHSQDRQMHNCTIVDNTAGEYAGGVYIKNNSSDLDAHNTIIWWNETATGDGDDVKVGTGGSSGTFENCAIDTTGFGGVVENADWSHGCNVFTAPLMCDPSNGDYSLRADSPCLPGNNPACPEGGLIGALDGIGCTIDSPVLLWVADVPEDQGLQVVTAFTRAAGDTAGAAQPILGYDIYRQVADKAAAASGGSRCDKLYGWEYLMTVPARGDHVYHATVPTLWDGDPADPTTWATFFISAVTADPTVYHDSQPMAGCSVDNLVPEPPAWLVAQYAYDQVTLIWDESDAPDVVAYRVYRGEWPDFDPVDAVAIFDIDGTRVDVPIDFDGGEVAWDHAYMVAAIDDAGQVGDAAKFYPDEYQADASVPCVAHLAGNAPNPFNPSTRIFFSLPVAQPVDLIIVDLEGRIVRRLLSGDMRQAGEHAVEWNGRDGAGRAVASGVYMCRLTTSEGAQAHRMLLAK